MVVFPLNERSLSVMEKTTHVKKSHNTGQIIATSHDLGLEKVADEGKSQKFQENPDWWNII